MKYQIAICDDDEFYLDKLKNNIISLIAENEVDCEIHMYTSGEKLLADSKVMFDIIFLDVEMQGKNGIEVANLIRRRLNKAIIIFVTAFIEYCPKGYEVSAFRYLLKDNRVFDRLLKEAFCSSLGELARRAKKYMFRFKGTSKVLRFSQIIYVESSVHELTFHVIENKKVKAYKMRKKLDDIEKILGHDDFCRIHKSYLVNMQYVKKCERYHVTLINNTVLNIARARYDDVISFS